MAKEKAIKFASPLTEKQEARLAFIKSKSGKDAATWWQKTFNRAKKKRG